MSKVLTRPITVVAPEGEGDWVLPANGDTAGDDDD